jgi:ADP-heptose:LPS heptosyltransferase
MKRVLFARQDNNGDVLLAGPAIRAVAASDARVTLLCGPRGQAAARTLPGVAGVLVWESGWIDAQPQPVSRGNVEAFVAEIEARAFDEAIVSTSFHQSPLPLALLLRMAGIARIGAISVDYPGSLLDVRHHVSDDLHEVQRGLSLARAMGYELPASDSPRMRMNDEPIPFAPFREYVVVHPGCTMPARTWSPRRFGEVIASLHEAGRNVVLTGDAGERSLAQSIVPEGPRTANLAGKTSFAQFAGIVKRASAVVCGNTAATHVASAVGTPVALIFPPTVPLQRFSPWMVPFVAFGDQSVACAGCRARTCPFEAQPCLSAIAPHAVAEAVEALANARIESAAS